MKETVDPLFFGYGSLVNRATHLYPDLRAATLPGWRRVWRHTVVHPTAFLTAVPDPDCTIEGVIARVPGGDWVALDTREMHYDRVPALIDSAPVAVYSIAEGRHGAPDLPHPILLSYVDVVVQGFAQVFGEDGVARFFDTTHGWDTSPVLDDRATPEYPRHQRLTDSERALVDHHLARTGARRITR